MSGKLRKLMNEVKKGNSELEMRTSFLGTDPAHGAGSQLLPLKIDSDVTINSILKVSKKVSEKAIGH